MSKDLFHLLSLPLVDGCDPPVVILDDVCPPTPRYFCADRAFVMLLRTPTNLLRLQSHPSPVAFNLAVHSRFTLLVWRVP